MGPVQATLAVGQVTFLFFSTVILLTQWNVCLQWVRVDHGFPVLRKVAHLPGLFFFSTLVTTNFVFAVSGELPHPLLGWVMLTASVVLLGFQVHSFLWLGFLRR